MSILCCIFGGMKNNKHLIVIEDHDILRPPMVIGVASNLENAFKMRDTYFGPDLVLKSIKDIRDSGLMFEEEYVIGNDEFKGTIVYREFVLNEI